MNVRNPFAQFYLLAEVHKSPLKTRPIISISGSLLHGPGRWVDGELQQIVCHIPFVIRSSFLLVKEMQMRSFDKRAGFFTADAVSMYTKIDTAHSLRSISDFLLNDPEICELAEVNVKRLLHTLRIVMTNNLFQFGDTYWIHRSRTAKGAPPAPTYATLYFAIHESRIVPNFPELRFYGRYIDDVIGV
jgi:hypothetical protein